MNKKNMFCLFLVMTEHLKWIPIGKQFKEVFQKKAFYCLINCVEKKPERSVGSYHGFVDLTSTKMLAVKSNQSNVTARTLQSDAKEKTTILKINVDCIYICELILPLGIRLKN